MKRPLAILMLLAVAALVGCTPSVWVKPGATAQQFEQDKAACMAQAEAGTAGLSPGFYSGYMTLDIAKNCLRGKGYTTASESTQSTPAAPFQPKIVIVRAPGQSGEQLGSMLKECEATAVNHADELACFKRNHLTVIPELEYRDYVQKALADGAIEWSDLENGLPTDERAKIAVDKLVWADRGLK